MGVVSAAGTFLRGLFGFGARIAGERVAAPVVSRVLGGVSRGAQATGRLALAGGRRIAPFAAAGVGGAIVGGTLLDDVGPDLAAQLRAMGIEPSQFKRRAPKVPELVFDPVSGATFRRVKKRRARGISAVELRGFRRVTDLLTDVGLAPRKIPTAGKKKKKR